MSDTRVIFITHYTELYGANRSLLNLIEGLSIFELTNILVIAPGDGKICDELKKRGVEYSIIPFVNETWLVGKKPDLFKKVAKLVYNWYIVLRYAKYLRKKDKTIIHTNSSATLIGAYFSLWMRVPHVWHIREFGLDDYNFNYNFGYKYFNFWVNKAKAVIAISRSIYEKRIKNCNTLRKEIIYNGVIFSNEIPEQNFSSVQSIRYEDEKIIFGIIGLICKEKGQDEAIDAFYLFNKIHKNAQLLIAGNGTDEYVEMLKQKVNEYHLESKVIFKGFIENANEFYNKLDCLLMCSKNEAFGRVTIEAMSKGVPVIGYNNAGTSEIIQDGYNGLLYSNGPFGLSEMMLMYARDKSMQRTMMQEALQTVKERFTIEAYSKAVYNVYQSV
ncbi:glycosyltransferase family 4 protein [soil metagenome]